MATYLGNFTNESDELIVLEILKLSQRGNQIGKVLFYKKYNQYPCEYYNRAYIPFSIISKILKEEFNHDMKNDLCERRLDHKNDYKFFSSILSDLGNGIMIHLFNGDLISNLQSVVKVDYTINKVHHAFLDLYFYFLPEKFEVVNNLIKLLIPTELKPITEASIQMICKRICDNQFYLTNVKIKKPVISNLKIHYGEEFEIVHNKIIDALKKTEESQGLVLLHGLPGSGKTHYIRYLINEITKKDLIYIPPDMVASILTPEFFPFMFKRCRNSILIIEDAENIIKSRESGGTTTQALANLLNLSDGLLGDSLNQTIIATFNCNLNTIDPALLRKGRLIARHEFGKLNIENAQKLSETLGFNLKITEPMTLAEIYSQ